ncbi:MAG: polysulfide reductase NrfD [Nitrospirae bacterium]|nr:polysulfide reductase NrfD [Nitrospirota bacterium]
MLEKALVGSKAYYRWIFFLLAVISVGVLAYIRQFNLGLGVTGMSRDVSFGFYIGQFTYFVGVAASAVMVVLPYYLHNYKRFGKITILGEFLAIPAVIMCVLFIFVDVGQPIRITNVLLHPTLNAIVFYDVVVLNGYLMLNLIIGWYMLSSEARTVAPPKWLKILIYISIPWAVSIHTVTAFLYCGLPGRHFWLTAITAARFLASAFASGPAFLVILALLVRRCSKFDPGQRAIDGILNIISYAMLINLFFIGLELFTAFYSGIPAEKNSFIYLFAGLDGYHKLVPVMWTSMILAFTSLAALLTPAVRKNENMLIAACLGIHVALWLDKGFGFVIGGFIPNPFDRVTEYWPTINELLVTAGVWAIGFLVLSILYRIAITVKEQSVSTDH